MRLPIHFLSGALLFTGVAAMAQSGSLDTTFSTAGKVTGISGGEQHIQSVALLPDGKILAAGSYAYNFAPGAVTNIPGDEFMLRRFLADGAADATFGTNGLVHFGAQNMSGARALAIQPDGKVVMVGISTAGTAYNGNANIDATVMRLTADGQLDTSFNTTGIYTIANAGADEMNDVLVQPDGKIVISGYFGSQNTVLRLTADGVPDATFGTNGYATTTNGGIEEAAGNAKSLFLQADGSILVSKALSSYLIVSKLTPDGVADTTFGIDGGFNIHLSGSVLPYDIIADATGNIYVSASRKGQGTTAYYGLVVALDATGDLRSDFGTDGIWYKDDGTGNGSHVTQLALSQGKLVLGISDGPPTNYDFTVGCLSTTGVADTTFGTNGFTTFYFDDPARHDYLNGMVLQPDDKIVVGGYSWGGVNLARLNGVQAPAAGVGVLANNRLTVYPNPANDKISINAGNSTGPVSVTLFNMLGAAVYSGSVNGGSEINVSQLPQGMYLLKADAGGKAYTQKVIIR